MCCYTSGFSGVQCEISKKLTTEAVLTSPLTGTAPSKEPCQPTNSCDGHYTCNVETAEQVCMSGYKGVDCRNSDFVGRNDPQCPTGGPCENGGTCWDKTCCCVNGFAGVVCQIRIVECLSQPCLHGGTCTEEFGYYRCECLPGKICIYRLWLSEDTL